MSPTACRHAPGLGPGDGGENDGKLVKNDGFVKINEALKAEKQKILQNNENINSAIANNVSSILLLVLSASTVLFGIVEVSHHVFFQKKVEPGQHGTTE